jgi:hypothetical protein
VLYHAVDVFSKKALNRKKRREENKYRERKRKES